MKIYIKNTDTNEISIFEAESYEALSKNFRQAPYVQSSASEKTAKKILDKQEELIKSRNSYLSSTDWHIAKEADEPNTYPQAVKDKRILARQEINQIPVATTLTALNTFSNNF